MENLRRTLRILFHSQKPQSILTNLKTSPKRFVDAWVDDKVFVKQLSYLDDVFWNHESIMGKEEYFGYENATAIAYALKELKNVIE